MALTPSTMMPLGTKAPDFCLPDTTDDGNQKTLSQLAGEKGTLIAFICNHCPYVIHIDDALVDVANQYQPKGIQFIAISSNSIETHPQDGPDAMAQKAMDKGYCFPYLYDEGQQTARDYDAACTPDLFLFDKDLRCVYRGQFDNTRPDSNQAANGEDLRKAMDALLTGQKPIDNQQASIGCNIKWKPET